MLVVLRVKEIPSDSSAGIFYLHRLITPVENFNFIINGAFTNFNCKGTL